MWVGLASHHLLRDHQHHQGDGATYSCVWNGRGKSKPLECCLLQVCSKDISSHCCKLSWLSGFLLWFKQILGSFLPLQRSKDNLFHFLSFVLPLQRWKLNLFHLFQFNFFHLFCLFRGEKTTLSILKPTHHLGEGWHMCRLCWAWDCSKAVGLWTTEMSKCFFKKPKKYSLDKKKTRERKAKLLHNISRSEDGGATWGNVTWPVPPTPTGANKYQLTWIWILKDFVNANKTNLILPI